MSDQTSPNPSNYAIPKSNVYFTPTGGVRRHVGNCPEASAELTTEQLEHFSSMTGVKTRDFTATTSKSMTISLTLEEMTRENMRIVMLGGDLEPNTEGEIGFEIGAASSVSGLLEFVASNDIGPRWDYTFYNVTFTPDGAVDLISKDDTSVASLGLSGDANAVSGSFGRATLQGSTT